MGIKNVGCFSSLSDGDNSKLTIRKKKYTFLTDQVLKCFWECTWNYHHYFKSALNAILLVEPLWFAFTHLNKSLRESCFMEGVMQRSCFCRARAVLRLWLGFNLISILLLPKKIPVVSVCRRLQPLTSASQKTMVGRIPGIFSSPFCCTLADVQLRTLNILAPFFFKGVQMLEPSYQLGKFFFMHSL